MANENYWLRNDGCLHSFIRWKTQIAFNFKILPNNLGQYDEIGEGKLSIVPRYTYNIYIYIYTKIQHIFYSAHNLKFLQIT